MPKRTSTRKASALPEPIQEKEKMASPSSGSSRLLSYRKVASNTPSPERRRQTSSRLTDRNEQVSSSTSASEETFNTANESRSTRPQRSVATESTPLIHKGRSYYDSYFPLLTYDQVPLWYRENPHIHTGYRRITYSYRKCIDSLFYIHNESGNIYTHLLGAALFLGLLIYTHLHLMAWVDTTQWLDHLVMMTFVVGAIICLGLSTIFHLFCCHSCEAAITWNKIDYVGIVVLIFASFVPAIYYGFFCEPVYQIVYIGFTFILGIITLYCTISKRFSGPQFRPFRTILFVLMGLSGVIPLNHSVWKYGVSFARRSLSADWLIMMALFYLVGAAVFAYRVPERWFPGKFDIYFHSHQIWHVLVVMAAVTHYFGVLKAYYYWHTYNHACQVDVHHMLHLL